LNPKQRFAASLSYRMVESMRMNGLNNT